MLHCQHSPPTTAYRHIYNFQNQTLRISASLPQVARLNKHVIEIWSKDCFILCPNSAVKIISNISVSHIWEKHTTFSV